mmetsp:Transcript_27834/g.75992  ORF Transcript_27834/g.75992 Transcript_27834/m.75992 type:complete len:127 (-) Transcript_27834:43-423(-)
MSYGTFDCSCESFWVLGALSILCQLPFHDQNLHVVPNKVTFVKCGCFIQLGGQERANLNEMIEACVPPTSCLLLAFLPFPISEVCMLLGSASTWRMMTTLASDACALQTPIMTQISLSIYVSCAIV